MIANSVKNMTKQILRFENIKAGYGKKEILHNISLEIHEGEIVALIGANGAGKSTVLKVAAGLLAPSQGKIFFNFNDITTWNCYTRVKNGIVYFIQGGEVFPSLTVQENPDIGLIGSSSRRKDKFEEAYKLFPERLSEKGLKLLCPVPIRNNF